MKTSPLMALRRHGLALPIAAALASGVSAQDAPVAPAPQEKTTDLQTITVTGSALPRIDVETPSPVTTISAEQIQKSGLTTVSDVVRAVSADNSGSIPSSFTAGFATGSSGVALRGLTVNSTLVLIDGRRAANYPLADDGQRSFVDLNTIPSNAIERIEVLKDGASSLYGADAIAGVVNIILRPDFRGTEFTADVGTSQHGGGTTRRANVLFGGGDLKKDGWNAYFSAEYQRDDDILNRQRGYPYNTADTLNFGYGLSKLESARWNTFSLSHVHAFSKRTEFYVQAAYQRAGGSARFAVMNGTGAGGATGVSGSDTQLVTTVGMHHSF